MVLSNLNMVKCHSEKFILLYVVSAIFCLRNLRIVDLSKNHRIRNAPDAVVVGFLAVDELLCEASSDDTFGLAGLLGLGEDLLDGVVDVVDLHSLSDDLIHCWITSICIPFSF